MSKMVMLRCDQCGKLEEAPREPYDEAPEGWSKVSDIDREEDVCSEACKQKALRGIQERDEQRRAKEKQALQGKLATLLALFEDSEGNYAVPDDAEALDRIENELERLTLDYHSCW